MKYSIIITIILFLQSCQTIVEEKAQNKPVAIAKEEVQVIPFDTVKHLKKYEQLKERIIVEKQKIRHKTGATYKEKISLAEDYLAKILVDSVFTYWLGTPWDFNGYTAKPRDGEIACGYFVSTTLRHLDIKLNRYKIAQKAASDIIYALCDKNSIKKVSSIEQVKSILEEVKDYEILIVGLDNHVGFLYKKEGQHYFAHSNYINRKGVMIEKMEKSAAFANSNLYVIGNFTKNKTITSKWLN